MRVVVQLTDLKEPVRAGVSSHIRTNWANVTIDGEAQTQQNGQQALLVIGTRPTSASATWPLQETIAVGESSLDEILFLVDAKLGKLAKSGISDADRGISTKSPMSRRDFLFGAFQKSSQPRDAPVVLHESCEARFGCRKCVDACPAEGALRIQDRSVVVSSEFCIRCGLCAGICPVAAIQLPGFSENAYRGLLAAIQNSPAPKKTLVITCDEKSVRPRPWMAIEQVPGIGVMGVRQLAMAAGSSTSETVVYCPDGVCAGKENAKKAANLISSVVNEETPVVSYVEGKDGAVRVDQIYDSARMREVRPTETTTPWKDYVNSLTSVSPNELQATGLGFTDLRVDDSCTLCNGCVDSCPHHALAINEDKLNLQPGECTGCGYCAEICPEHSITLFEMKGLMTMQIRTVYKAEMVRCEKCGSPYASAKMVKKVSTILHDDVTTKLCPSCRQTEIYDKIFGGAYKTV